MNKNIISIEGLFEINDTSYQSKILYIGTYDEDKTSYVEKNSEYSYYFHNTPLKYIQLYLDGVIIARYLYKNKNIDNFEEEYKGLLIELKEIKKELYKFRSFNKHKTKRRNY